MEIRYRVQLFELDQKWHTIFANYSYTLTDLTYHRACLYFPNNGVRIVDRYGNVMKEREGKNA